MVHKRILATILTLGALTACNSTDGGVVGTETGTGTGNETGTGTGNGTGTGTGTAPTGSADCVLSNSPYVVDCAATLVSPGSAVLELSAAGLPTRTFVSDAAETDHHIWGWGLRADTTYDWTLAGNTGQVTTGPTPQGLSGLNITVSGSLSGIDAAMVYVNCGYFVMIDGDGEVIGGIPTSIYNNFLDGMLWAPETLSFLAASDSNMGPGISEFREVHISGSEVLAIPAGSFDFRLTHDVGRWGEYTYLLGGSNSGEGFEVFQGTTSLGSWRIEENFAVNTSHLNGTVLSEDGIVIVSDLWNNAIIAVDGDPNSASFLQVLWHAAGAAGGGLGNADFEPAQGTLFSGQHNASLHGDELWVFDNGSQASARALRMGMDATTGVLTQLDSWSTGRSCPNQGGAIPIPGGALVTCANSGDVYMFRDGAGSADWTLNASCGGGGLGQSTRAFPVIVE